MPATRADLQRLLAAERDAFAAARPRSVALARDAREHLLMGVPMPWMVRWSGGVPIFLDHAEGSRVTDADGHEYVDVSLGDTGAMTGHSPAPVTEAIAARRGITAMMPTADAMHRAPMVWDLVASSAFFR